jgi:light-regulated signal transduction histidine kinase (bacteriophytochrome)
MALGEFLNHSRQPLLSGSLYHGCYYRGMGVGVSLAVMIVE